MDDAANPYQSPSPEPVANRQPAPSPQELTLRQRIVRYVVSTLVVIAFLGFGYLGFQLSVARQWTLSLLAVSAALMCIPIVSRDLTFGERFALSLIMPFAVCGMATFVVVYFLMFYFDWFRAVFNNKGGGELGLILSASSGLGFGGMVGWQIVKRALRLLARRRGRTR